MLPGDGGKDVVSGVAALNQRRRHDDRQETGIAQQGAGAVVRGRGGRWMAERLKSEADERPEPRHRRDHPDQMLGRDDIDQQPAGQRAHHERRRAPQPQRPVFEAITRHASQRVGVR